MKYVLGRCALIGLVAGLAAVPAVAEVQSELGLRQLPAKTIPVPDTVSPQMRAIIARPVNPIWNVVPKTAAEWKAVVAQNAAETVATLPAMRAALHVKVEPAIIAGVKTYIVTPEVIPSTNRNRLLIYFHGGGFVLRPGEAGIAEAIEAAGFGHFKVISVDYRMSPDFPYPPQWMMRWRSTERR